MIEKQAGWFVYVRYNGRTSFHKYCIEGDALLPDSAAYYREREIAKFPLSVREYAESLDVLALRYPLTEGALAA